MVERVISLREDIIGVRIESHRNVPIRTTVRAPNAKHPPKHCRIARDQLIWANTTERTYSSR